MVDTTFRTPIKQVESEPEIMPKRADSKPSVETESFLGYETENSPYLSKYYDVENVWSDPSAGFKEDFDFINNYFKDKINKGEMTDSIEAVKDKMKWIEKLANIDKNERIVMKIEKTKAFIRFLKETDQIKVNGAKYAIK